MNKQVFIGCAFAIGFANATISGQEKKQEKVKVLEEVVVTATKFNLKKENTGKVIYTISQKELQNYVGQSVTDVLNRLPGVEIKGNTTNLSEPRSTYFRGGRSRQVLVLIDGVPVSDASGINQEYDLRLLSLSQIESIEVLKGASSTLYGSGAATGVINIQLKKAAKKSIGGSYEVHLGTQNDANSTAFFASNKSQNAQVNGNFGKFHFLSSFGLLSQEGMSAAKSNTTAIFGEDRYYGKNGLLKLGYNFSEKLAITTFLNYDAFDYDFDAGAYADSDVNEGNQEQLRLGIQPKYQYENGELYVLASINRIKRNINQFNSFGNTLDNYVFEGESLHLDLVHKYSFLEGNFQIITGINYQEHKNNTVTPFATIDKNIANFNTLDPYASLVYISDYGLSFNAGARLNMHNVYGNHLVYDVNLAHIILKSEKVNVKLLTSYSTAFIAPSLYQLYDGFSGNIDLKPESNETFEAGFELNYQDWIQFDVVYFDRKEKDAIIFDTTIFAYANGTSDASGFELNTKIAPTSFLTFNAGYSFTDKDDFEGANDYIPKHKIVAGFDITATQHLFMNLNYQNVGERTLFDRYGGFGTAGEDVVLPSYQIIDFTANYSLLKEKVTFFTRVHNLLNEDYDAVLGYSTLGRNYTLGVRIQF